MVHGCWIWQSTLDTNGYSKVGIIDATKRFKTTIGHRIAYQLYAGPIPEGMTLDHSCSNRACVYPPHLEPMTQGENNRKRDDKRYGAGKFPCGHLRSETSYPKKEGYAPDGTPRVTFRCKPCVLAYYRRKNDERRKVVY